MRAPGAGDELRGCGWMGPWGDCEMGWQYDYCSPRRAAEISAQVVVPASASRQIGLAGRENKTRTCHSTGLQWS